MSVRLQGESPIRAFRAIVPLRCCLDHQAACWWCEPAQQGTLFLLAAPFADNVLLIAVCSTLARSGSCHMV
jgi:hypothetical protein